METLKENIRKACVLLSDHVPTETDTIVLDVLRACERAIDAIKWTYVSDSLPVVPVGEEWLAIIYEDEKGDIKEGKYHGSEFFGWAKLSPRPIRWSENLNP